MNPTELRKILQETLQAIDDVTLLREALLGLVPVEDSEKELADFATYLRSLPPERGMADVLAAVTALQSTLAYKGVL